MQTTLPSPHRSSTERSRSANIRRGAGFGLCFGVLGGVAANLALAGISGIWSSFAEDLEGVQRVGEAIFIFVFLAIVGLIPSTVLGGGLGTLAGSALAALRWERAASWLTAAICGAVPLITFFATRSEGELFPALVVASVTMTFVIIGYVVGTHFERQMLEK